MDLRLNANVIVENNAGKILVVKLKGGAFANGICIPGGGINAGELGREAVMREVQEETGIRIFDAQPIGFCELIRKKNNSHRVVILFHAKAEGCPVETEEGVGMWMEKSEVISFGIPFTKCAVEMWRNGKIYFDIVE